MLNIEITYKAHTISFFEITATTANVSVSEKQRQCMKTENLNHMQCFHMVWKQSTCVGIHFTPETYLMSFKHPSPLPSGYKLGGNFLSFKQPNKSSQNFSSYFFNSLPLLSPGPLHQKHSERRNHWGVKPRRGFINSAGGSRTGDEL